MDELGVGKKQIFIYYDSQSAIFLAKNPMFCVRMKHIDVHYQFMQEIISEKLILFQKIETAENPVDLLSKVLTTIKFNHCFDLINIVKV